MRRSEMLNLLVSARNRFDDVASMLLELGNQDGHKLRAEASGIHAAINELRNKEQL